MRFDRAVERSGTWSEKYDSRTEKFGDASVMPLWVADMDLPASEAIQEALQARTAHPIYGYTRYPEAYIDAVAHWMRLRHSWEVQRSWIAPINAIVPALHLAVEQLSDPGEAIMIQPPIYPPFYAAVRRYGCKVLENPLRLHNGCYEIDFDDFARKAKEAKLFLFCSPHNPTGRVWRREELERIVSICREEGVTIVSDEVHADLVYPGASHTPIASLPEAQEITITLNAPSKTFNVAGIVNAYAIVPNASLRRKFLEIFHRYALIQANPFSVVATLAAYTGSEAWLSALLEYLRENRIYLERRFEAMERLRPLATEATFLLWIDCRKMQMEDDALEKWFVSEAGLGLNPGRSFGTGGSGFMRLNFALPRVKLEEAMDRLERAYRNR